MGKSVNFKAQKIYVPVGGDTGLELWDDGEESHE